MNPSLARLRPRSYHHLPSSSCSVPLAVRPVPALLRQSHLAFDAKDSRSFGDQLTDFVLAGPKLRKWYGAAELGAESPVLTDEEAEEQAAERRSLPEGGDVVLVTGAETATGEMVLMHLIMARARVKVLVDDVAAARMAYGPYVEPLAFNIDSAAAMKQALQGVSVVLCLGRLGAVLPAAKQAGVRHVVLLSAAGTTPPPSGFSLAALMGGDDLATVRDTAREKQVAACGVAYSVVRCAGVRDAQGGQTALSISQVPGQGGNIGREDLAAVLCNTLVSPPVTGRLFQVCSGSPGAMPSDWDALLSGLEEE